MAKKGGSKKTIPKAETYKHPEADSPLRPEVGTQPQFKKKKPPQRYQYDSSLSPTLDWDGQNCAREQGEWLLSLIAEAAALPAPHIFEQPRELLQGGGKKVSTVRGLQDAIEQLQRLSQPFLNWAGKAEHLSFVVPGLYDDSVWDHLAGIVSAPFEAGEHGQVAVKVIDDRGNELLVVKSLQETTT